MTAPQPTVAADHPLAAVTAAEITTARTVLERAGHVGASTRFPLIALEEPAKAEVLAHRPGDPVDRRLRCVLLDTATGAAHQALVSVTHGALVSCRPIDTGKPPYGQPPIMESEYALVDEIVKADPRWRAAMADRGVTDLDAVFVAPLSAGQFGFPDERGHRVLRALCFLRDHPGDSPWAHPVDGLLTTVDLIGRRVIRLDDTGAVPVPAEPGNYDPAAVGPARTTLRPLEITQPDGPSFHVDGSEVTWQDWRFRVSLDPREGLVLHTLAVRDGGRYRQVTYRASIAEMVVPYGDPSPTRFWINYFDSGEYNLGQQANSLVLGCDCLGEIHYFDATLADDHGHPYVLRNAICMHEEDYGVLWKHTDTVTGTAHTRRSRRLVVSCFVTVGNYDYGFYWYFYLDGTIEMEVKLTGIVFTAPIEAGRDWPYGSEVAPGLAAPYHQHLFCARLDMTVDGTPNAVREVDVVPVEPGPDNPHGNAFRTRVSTLARESGAGRPADPSRARTWLVVNPGSPNRLGHPVGYQLVPRPDATLLAGPDSAIAHRAAFATRHLWVTRYDPAERYPAGDYPNQHTGGAGIPAWITADRALDGEDVVLWHTFGATHIPRPEDWPVMPVAYTGFTLRPVGFFDRNPALDLPASTGHCCTG